MSAALAQSRLPLFPLNTVVFPGGQLPLRIFEQRYLDMVKQAIADSTSFGICAPAWGTPSTAIREGTETGTPTFPTPSAPACASPTGICRKPASCTSTPRQQERFVIRSTHTEPGGLLIGTRGGGQQRNRQRHSRRTRTRRRNPAPHHRRIRRGAFPCAARIRQRGVGRLPAIRSTAAQASPSNRICWK